MQTVRISERRSEAIRGESIGDILLNAGRLSAPDLARIVALQAKENLLFGEAAVVLGILSREDVNWALSCQFSYPCAEAGESGISPEVFAAHDGSDSRVESLRTIRSGLLLSGVGNIIRTVAVLSPGAGEGRSWLAANLSVVFAQLGLRTLLVDLNLRNPRQHQLFSVKNNLGASSLIIRRAVPEQVLQRTGLAMLDLLPSGPAPPNPLELLSWQETRDLFQHLRDEYQVIICDTPAFGFTADAKIIAALCDASLLLVRRGSTGLGPMAAMKKELDASKTRLLGAVLNQVPGEERG